MTINRRAAIKSFLIVSAGVTFIPSCMQEKQKPSITLRHIKIDGQQEKMLAELAETIIPATDTPGAKDVSAHLFAMKMVDDCYAEKDQVQFTKGLDAFEKIARKRYDESFARCTVPQREALLAGIESKQGMPEEVLAFYGMMKKLTIQAYTSSRYFLTTVQVYELVPSRFHGCVPLNPSTQKATTI